VTIKNLWVKDSMMMEVKQHILAHTSPMMKNPDPQAIKPPRNTFIRGSYRSSKKRYQRVIATSSS
jgi:hypothetical protein